MNALTKEQFGEAWLKKSPADSRHHAAIVLELLDRWEKMHQAGEEPDELFLRTIIEAGAATGFANETQMRDLVDKILSYTGQDTAHLALEIPLWHHWGEEPEY